MRRLAVNVTVEAEGWTGLPMRETMKGVREEVVVVVVMVVVVNKGT